MLRQDVPCIADMLRMTQFEGVRLLAINRIFTWYSEL
jgi:hypothetical protein